MAGATAERARQCFLYLVIAGMWVFIQQSFGRHDNARRAEPALDGAVLDKGFLNGMQGLGAADAFDGADGFSHTLYGKSKAG